MFWHHIVLLALAATPTALAGIGFSRPELPIHVAQWPGQHVDLAPLHRALQDTLNFRSDIRLQFLPKSPLTRHELVDQILSEPDTKRFIQLGDFRQSRHLRFAMPISIASDGVRPDKKKFALFAIDSWHNVGQVEGKKRVHLIGYLKAKGQHVGEVEDRMKWTDTFSMGPFGVGKLFTKHDIWDQLLLHHL